MHYIRAEPEEGPPVPMAGGPGKKGPQVRLRTFVRAYSHTRTEVYKKWFRPFPLSTLITI